MTDDAPEADRAGGLIRSRRSVLATAGAVALAGCGSPSGAEGEAEHSVEIAEPEDDSDLTCLESVAVKEYHEGNFLVGADYVSIELTMQTGIDHAVVVLSLWDGTEQETFRAVADGHRTVVVDVPAEDEFISVDVACGGRDEGVVLEVTENA